MGVQVAGAKAEAGTVILVVLGVRRVLGRDQWLLEGTRTYSGATDSKGTRHWIGECTFNGQPDEGVKTRPLVPCIKVGPSESGWEGPTDGLVSTIKGALTGSDTHHHW
ncbi:hypothetical protein NDU88_001944 [Pleurodeles waltl]|uniref:Uncharacterized protein n=1 Tax=Pleurodeles waltl TaxID=8319 RepID=A0AAV7U7V2_PLEWA|nr:hypothetical protein NDU88_001944 [Pleurodeles waltl]